MHVLIPIIAKVAMGILYWKDAIDFRSNNFGCCSKLAICGSFEIGLKRLFARHQFDQHLLACPILVYPFLTCCCCCRDVRMHCSFRSHRLFREKHQFLLFNGNYIRHRSPLHLYTWSFGEQHKRNNIITALIIKNIHREHTIIIILTRQCQCEFQQFLPTK